MEDFGKVYYMGSMSFQFHLLCKFLIRLSQGEYLFYIEVPNEVINYEFTLPLWSMYLKSYTGGVWNSIGVANYTTTTYIMHIVVLIYIFLGF